MESKFNKQEKRVLGQRICNLLTKATDLRQKWWDRSTRGFNKAIYAQRTARVLREICFQGASNAERLRRNAEIALCLLKVGKSNECLAVMVLCGEALAFDSAVELVGLEILQHPHREETHADCN